jgi:hypothetical protein
MARRKHELGFEDFDLRVEREDDGEIWISFHCSGKCVLTMTWEDLREVVDFAAVHGLGMQAPYIVEMADVPDD